jgi:argininosuccinate lyase
MEPEEINNKIETMKTYLEELYGAGIIKPAEYNDIWAKIDEIKVHVKYNRE